MRWILVICLVALASMTRADTIVAAKTVRAHTILTAADLAISTGFAGTGITDVNAVIGMEARVVLYAGRPILPQDLTAPARVRRNEIVPLTFRHSGLSISTSGRALDRGAVGDVIRVMNIGSRATLFGTVMPNGTVDVSPPSGGS